MDLWELDVAGMQAAYQHGECSPREVVDRLLDRIDRHDADLGAFRQVLPEEARADAARLTEELAAGRSRGPLHGVPFVVKELIDVEGASGCCGSKVLAGRVGSRDAAAVERLRAAGGIVLGVTRSHEFGWGITTQHAELGSTRNPWDLGRVPGGSSGGSAAAVAAGMAPLALGTDAGGSIRIPASCCGVTGLKPTFGRVSKRGVVALAPSLDHVGVLARHVEDLGTALSVLAGYDPDDPSMRRDSLPELPAGFAGDLQGLRVAHLPALHLVPLAPDYEAAFRGALAAAEAGGATLLELGFENPESIRAAFVPIQMAEAFYAHTVTLGTYPSRASDYGPDVRERFTAAAAVTVGDYLQAQHEALLIRRRFEAVFAHTDVFLTPVMAGPPSTTADPDRVDHLGKSLPFRDLAMPYTVPQNLTGLPSCAVPVGFDENGLPLALQVTAPWGREDLALRVGNALHRLLGMADRRPPFPAAVP